MQRIISVALLFLLMTSYSLACSMFQMPQPAMSSVNAGAYILVGEVIGYTEPITDANNFRGEAVGLKIKPLEIINLPSIHRDYVELFMFAHGPDCFPEARGPRPQLGTRFRFSLLPARLVASSSGSHVRVESRVFDRIGIDEAMFGYSTTANSEFDYKNDLRPLAQKFASKEMMDKRQWLSDFLNIETSKDLLRLQKAKTEKERMALLVRLLYCPDINYRQLVYSRLGELPEPNFLKLLPGATKGGDKPTTVNLSKAERRLLDQRTRLESSGELNIWK